MIKLVAVVGPRRSGKTERLLRVFDESFSAQRALFAQSSDITAESGSHFTPDMIGTRGELVDVHSIADVVNKAIVGDAAMYGTVVLNNVDTFRREKTQLAIKTMLERGIDVLACAVDVDEDGIYPDNTKDLLAMASTVHKTAEACAHIPELLLVPTSA